MSHFKKIMEDFQKKLAGYEIPNGEKGEKVRQARQFISELIANLMEDFRTRDKDLTNLKFALALPEAISFMEKLEDSEDEALQAFKSFIAPYFDEAQIEILIDKAASKDKEKNKGNALSLHSINNWIDADSETVKAFSARTEALSAKLESDNGWIMPEEDSTETKKLKAEWQFLLDNLRKEHDSSTNVLRLVHLFTDHVHTYFSAIGKNNYTSEDIKKLLGQLHDDIPFTSARAQLERIQEISENLDEFCQDFPDNVTENHKNAASVLTILLDTIRPDYVFLNTPLKERNNIRLLDWANFKNFIFYEEKINQLIHLQTLWHHYSAANSLWPTVSLETKMKALEDNFISFSNEIWKDENKEILINYLNHHGEEKQELLDTYAYYKRFMKPYHYEVPESQSKLRWHPFERSETFQQELVKHTTIQLISTKFSYRSQTKVNDNNLLALRSKFSDENSSFADLKTALANFKYEPREGFKSGIPGLLASTSKLIHSAYDFLLSFINEKKDSETKTDTDTAKKRNEILSYIAPKP